MKKPVALSLLLALAASLLAGCGNLTPAFAGLNATLTQIERDSAGRVQATIRFGNPNLAAYNVGKTVHRVYFEGSEVGRIELDRPFGIPPQRVILQTGELKVENQAALDQATASGSANYRLDTTMTFQLMGDNREVIKSSASGTVPVK